MQVHEFPNARAALAFLLTLPMKSAPQDAAVQVRLVSEEVGGAYMSEIGAQVAADPKLASTAVDYAMGGDSDMYEVDYLWYTSDGIHTDDCVGAILTHHNGGRAYAIW